MKSHSQDRGLAGPIKPMSVKEMQAGQVQAVSKRVFRGDHFPDPMYVNAVEFTSMGMDVFMDAGIVSPESVAAAVEKSSGGGDPPVVDFVVTFRLGMSFQTALMLQQRLGDMLQRSHAQLAAQVEQAEKQQGQKEGQDSFHI